MRVQKRNRVSQVMYIGITVSLRLGHASGLTVHRTVIQYLGVASLPLGKAKESAFPIKGNNRQLSVKVLFGYLKYRKDFITKDYKSQQETYIM